uniref:G-protein coupled receptors family 2 profile 2 domain-containing protein n=1 Tax=Bicosoecida sp. CB-2014 TaxID=1486930 RepID=A0A7S1CKR8_9STRA|mmetsp:Transcript_457/g.1276  ORF Transcript_457/g.1276 Transcript_457/m.1276 type:complete len:442 (+) Transcript_457:142-1467(+)
MAAIAAIGIDPGRVHVTPAQFETLQDWFKVLNTISLVLSAVTVATNLLQAKKRAFPSRLTTCFAVAAFGFHVALSLSYLEDWATTASTPPDVPPERWSSCEVQAIFFAYFSTAVVFWWLIISFNLHRVVHMELTVKQARAYEPAYHVAGWGAPLLQVALLFGFKGYGTEVGALYCWITTKDHAVWKLLAFYGTLTTFSVVGLVWSYHIMSKLSKFHRRRMRVQRAALMRARASARNVRGSMSTRGSVTGEETPFLTGAEDSDGARDDDLSIGRGGGMSATEASAVYVASSPNVSDSDAGRAVAQASSSGGSYFSYYLWRQAMFMLVMLIRFVGFVVWQANYMLFTYDASVVSFPLCFVVNYLVCSVGSDTFFLICLTRENTARLCEVLHGRCSSLRAWRRRGDGLSADTGADADTDADSVAPSGGLGGMTPERPKRAPLRI